MWVSINMGYEYTVVKQIPVVLDNMKEGQVLKYPVPKYMTVRFRGTGWLLAGIYLSSNMKYYIDVSSITKRDYIITSRDLPEHVKLPASIQTEDAKPDSLVLALDEYREKRVPVVPRLTVDYRDGYSQIGSASVQPESVVISGAANLIDSINEWQLVHQKFEDQHGPIDEEIPLEEPSTFSIELNPPSARLRMDIEHVAERTIQGVPVTAMAVPPSREVIFIPPKMDIIVRGGIDQLGKLTTGDFQATVEFPLLVQDSSGVIEPTLSAPREIKVIRKTPERFQFVIRKKL
jgi:hypothetical protein